LVDAVEGGTRGTPWGVLDARACTPGDKSGTRPMKFQQVEARGSPDSSMQRDAQDRMHAAVSGMPTLKKLLPGLWIRSISLMCSRVMPWKSAKLTLFLDPCADM